VTFSHFRVRDGAPAQHSIVLHTFYWIFKLRKWWASILLVSPFTQESHTTLIGCAESVPAHKYKITCNPLEGGSSHFRGRLIITWLRLHSINNKLIVSNTLIVLSLLNEIKPKSLKLSTLFIFYFKIWISLSLIPLNANRPNTNMKLTLQMYKI
jgi:hypothetical protein